MAKSRGNHSYKLSYTQRISRPQIWYLNPYLNASDAHSPIGSAKAAAVKKAAKLKTTTAKAAGNELAADR